YWEGLVVVPVVLLAYIFQGVYFNLSFWYKLNDKTKYGAYMSLIGCVINVVLIIMLVPMIGYMGAALASLATYFIMMLISYFWGQKYLPVEYDFMSIGIYFVFAAVLYGASLLFAHCMRTYAGVDDPWINMGFNTVLLLVYLAYLLKKDLPIYRL
ncbi:MAG: polysaccharide biosynthesis C-terminal domain-containing protein, partial [Paludibacteraceae bacterium]|nr:polysaccharide biosynthesis C-terminal domain-containing protein [Paludibacteraceae bacterium]